MASYLEMIGTREGDEECMTSVLGNLQFCWITFSFVELAGGMRRGQELL